MRSFSPEWEKIHSSKEWGAYPSESVIRFVARNFYSKERNNIKILDFGCGAGANTWYLAREGFNVYAFDGSKSAVENTKKRLDKESLKADIRVLDGMEIDYPDNFFDAVIDNVAIYANTYNSIEIMYAKCYSILKSGGRLFTSCITPETDGYGTGEKIAEYTFRNATKGFVKGAGIVHFMVESKLRSCLEKVGFKNIVIDRMSFSDNGIKAAYLITSAEK